MDNIVFYFQNRWVLTAFAVFALLVLMWRARFLRVTWLKRLGINTKEYPTMRAVYRPYKEVFYFLGTVALAIASLGPQWGQKEQTVVSRGLDLCIALDLSSGMDAEDVSPSRLKLIKNHLTIQLENLRGHKIGLVAFAGTAFAASPLTSDPSALASLVDIMDTTYFSDRSTNIGAGLDSCLGVLKAQEARRAEDLPEDRGKAVLLLTDGEDNNGDYEDVVKKYKALGIPIFSMAAGTLEGTVVPVRDTKGNLEKYVKDPETGKPAMTKRRDDLLREFAKETGGKVYYLPSGVIVWGEFFEDLEKLKQGTSSVEQRRYTEHHFDQFALIAFLFLFLEFLIFERSIFGLSKQRRQ